MINPFGLAEIRKEGGKLWPQDFLMFNNRLPPKDFYTVEELAEHAACGYTDDYYAKESHD